MNRPNVPITLGAAAGGWVLIGHTGSYSDPRFGDFEISTAMVEAWKRGLASGAVTGEPGRIALDYDHSADAAPGGSTRASGWIRDLRLSGDRIEALIEWTPAAKEAIKNGEYRYFSLTFSDTFLNDQAQDVGPTLVGGSLTNRPFLRSKGALTVSLSQDDVVALEQRVRALCADPPPVRARQLVPGAQTLTGAPPAAYEEWAASSPFGGDHPAGRKQDVDAGRAELHVAVMRQLASDGGDDYSGALDKVLAQAAAGVITLSAGALAGTGVRASAPDPARSPQHLDTVKSLAHRRDPDRNPDPGTGAGYARSRLLDQRHEALVALAQARGETLEQTIARIEGEA